MQSEFHKVSHASSHYRERELRLNQIRLMLEISKKTFYVNCEFSLKICDNKQKKIF